LNGDGTKDIVTSPMAGGPNIRVYSTGGTLLTQFNAFDSALRGSFTATAGNLNGDATAEIVVAPGNGFGPQVRSFDANGNALSQFWVTLTK